MVVAGREDMADPPSDMALKQLELRYRHGAMLSRSFVQAGIHAVHVDNIYGATPPTSRRSRRSTGSSSTGIRHGFRDLAHPLVAK